MECVLVVNTGSLLAAGVERVLSRETDLHVVTIAPKCEAAVIEEVRLLQPDVIVLDEGAGIIDVTKLLVLLEEYSDLRVVTLRVSDTWVGVYDKHKTLLTQIADLVAIIRYGWNPPCTRERAFHSR
ncbi:MAG: DNA-binding response regulator [Chloroflexi bacterium]|nr:MAG: DNA-binding response regulator [Chloroflexota bacterium]